MKCPKSILVKLKSENFLFLFKINSLLSKINYKTIIDFAIRNQTKMKRIRIDFDLLKLILGSPNGYPNMLFENLLRQT